MKLAAELSRPDTGRTLYLLDEPTTGLHFDDLARLLDVLNRLVDLGNTVVVIEHNLDVIKTADWVIDMGPEAGEEGGYLVAVGTPEDVAAHPPPAAALVHRRGSPAGAGGRARGRSGRSTTSPPRRPAAKATWRSTRSAARPTCPGRSTAAAGTPRTATAATGSPAAGTAASWPSVVDRIEDAGLFSPTDWNSRSVVEISAAKKSAGWFFHAITGEEWLLKLKFRTARSTFRREELVARLDLKPLNDMPDLPRLRPRAAGQGPPGPRAVPGDRAAGPRLRGDRSAGLLEVRRPGDRRLPQVHRPRPAESRRPHALEGTGPQMAFPRQGLFLRQAARVGLRGARRSSWTCWRRRPPRASSSGATSR